MHPARLCKQLDDGKVQCRLCNHFCIVPPGGTGQCGVRTNRDGVLHTLTYGRIAAFSADPVEKKPLFHFLPGTKTLSFATMGCNLSCSFCQNYSLSQPPRQGEALSGQSASPEELADAAIQHGCRSVSYTYSEPTVFFELMQDTAQAAHERGLKNVVVSNGFMSRECLDALSGLIHAANIDLKSFSEEFYREICGARLAPVLDNLRRMVAMGWWVEVTTLVIPGLNDSDEELSAIAGFIAGELGPHVPWHVSRFHPDYGMTSTPPTPVATLERAWRAGRDAGLKYVYTGNVPGHDGESTTCPACGKPAINRVGFTLRSGSGFTGRCDACGETLEGIWHS